jgi:hypothetical protein
MKKLAVLVILTLTLLGFASCSDTKVAPNGMIDATAPDAFAYSFYVPKTWKDSSYGGISMAVCSSEDPASISLTQYTLASGVTDNASFWDSCKQDYAQNFSDFTVISESNCMLGGTEAGQYEFTATIAGTQMKYMNVIAVKDDMAYVMTYSSIPENYDSHLEDVTKVIQNFIFN